MQIATRVPGATTAPIAVTLTDARWFPQWLPRRLPHALVLAALLLAFPGASTTSPAGTSAGILLPQSSAPHAQAHTAASVAVLSLRYQRAHVHTTAAAIQSVHRVVMKVVARVFTAYAYSPMPSGIAQWAYTGHAAYWVGWRSGAYSGGQCTWYAWSRDTRLWGLGNAGGWAAAARARGLPVSSTPWVGATVVFAGGVQGASSLGHVAHVEAVYPGGWFLISEMNFSFAGGGWGIVSYRYAHIGWGVSFIG